MASVGTITVDVRIGIDKDTANVCLKIVEMYMNQYNVDVIGTYQDDGSTKLRYEPRPAKEDE